MSAINLDLRTNNLPLATQNSNPKLYLGSGNPNLPGLSNIIYAPYELFKSAQAGYEAYKIGDHEGLRENALRSIGAPLNFVSSSAQIAAYALNAGMFLNLASKEFNQTALHLTKGICILGFIISGIEGILETIGLSRSALFLKNTYPSELKKLKKACECQSEGGQQEKFLTLLRSFLEQELPIEVKTEIENLRTTDTEFCEKSRRIVQQIKENVFLNKLKKLECDYFQISPLKQQRIEAYIQRNFAELSSVQKQEKKEKIINNYLLKKKNNLIRRVYPWLYNEIKNASTEIIQNLQSTEANRRVEGAIKAAELLKKIQMQSYKKILIHSVGLLAALVTIASLIAVCAGCPFLGIVILVSISSLLALSRYGLDRSLLKSKTWQFRMERCFPKFLRVIYRTLTAKEKFPPSPPLSSYKLTLPKERPSQRPRINYTITVCSRVV